MLPKGRFLLFHRNWQLGVLSSWMIMGGLPGLKKKTFLGCKTGKRPLKRFTSQRGKKEWKIIIFLK